MAALLRGSVTVERAAELTGLLPRVILDNAVLGGRPKGYGPFRAVDGSDFRVMICEEDLMSWSSKLTQQEA